MTSRIETKPASRRYPELPSCLRTISIFSISLCFLAACSSDGDQNQDADAPDFANSKTVNLNSSAPQVLTHTETLTIAWTASDNVNVVNLTLLDDSEPVLTIAENVSADDGEYTWTVPSDAPTGNRFFIAIEDANQPQVSDTSS